MSAPSPLVQRLLWSVTAVVLFAATMTWVSLNGSSTRAASSSHPAGQTVAGAAPPVVGATGTGSNLKQVVRPLPPPPGNPSANDLIGGADTTASGPATTVSPIAVPAPGLAGNPGAVHPTRSGTYLYTETVHSSRHNSTSTLTEKVVDEPSTTSELRQSVTDTDTDGPAGAQQAGAQQAGAQQAGAQQEVSWRADGLYVRVENFGAGGISLACPLDPPLQELALPLAVGKRWALEGTCQVIVFGQPIAVTIHGTARVSGTDRVAVGGQAVDVWIIDSVLDITGRGTVNFTAHQTATRRLAPQRGVQVTESSTTSATLGLGTPMVVDESRQLRSLPPG